MLLLFNYNVFAFCSIKDGGKDGLLEVVSAEHSKLSAMVLELTESDDDPKPTRSSGLPNARGEKKRKGEPAYFSNHFYNSVFRMLMKTFYFSR